MNDKIIHKVKDDLLKLFESNPREINNKNQLSVFSTNSHTETVVDGVYRRA